MPIAGSALTDRLRLLHDGTFGYSRRGSNPGPRRPRCPFPEHPFPSRQQGRMNLVVAVWRVQHAVTVEFH